MAAPPTLTPSSQTSAIILPVTGSPSDVSSALPFGIYTHSTDFLSGASDQVAYVYKKLGGDVLDIEIKADNVYAAYEEAVLEYSYIVNIHQSKNVLGDVLGNTTGTFDHNGEIKSGAPLSSSLGTNADGNRVNLKLPRFRFEYAKRVNDGMAVRSNAGGDQTEYSASISLNDNQQDYDLQALIKTAADDSGNDFYNKVGDKKVSIRRVFYKSPHAMWRFFGYYGGLNTVGNMSNYGMYSDDSSFQLIPAYHNKLQAMTFEDNVYTRVSHYSYEIHNNQMRIFPSPDSSASPKNVWVTFTVKEDAWEADSNKDNGINGVNNMNTIPFSNIPYENINAIGKQWIRRFALALSKEILGQIRSKFGSIPIPGESVDLNGGDLISQGREEQDKLREELKLVLDELTYAKLVDQDATMVESAQKIEAKAALPIFVG